MKLTKGVKPSVVVPEEYKDTPKIIIKTGEHIEIDTDDTAYQDYLKSIGFS